MGDIRLRRGGVSNGVPIAATASPVPARNTLRRVRIVGGIIMYIIQVEDAACERGTGSVGKGIISQCRSQLSFSTYFDYLGKRPPLHHSRTRNDTPHSANSLN